MSTITRNLSNIAGANVTNPDANAFTSTGLESYANDAAFEAVHTAQAGSLYWNTTEKLIRQYNGTAWQYDKTIFSAIVDAATTGSGQDISPDGVNQVIRFTQGSLASIRGISPANQKVIHLVNDQATQALTILNEAAAATAANRIITGSNLDFVLLPGRIVSLVYDEDKTRWYLLSGPRDADQLQVFANDAAYATAHPGTIRQGAMYFNSTDMLVRQYNGTSWQNDKTSFETQNDSTTTGSNQDVTPNSVAQVIRFTQGSLASIRSLVPTNQKAVWLVNGQVSTDIIIKNEDAGATAANRIVTGSGNDFTLKPTQMLALVYDAVGLRWRLAGGGSGGGLVPTLISGAATVAAGINYLTNTSGGAFTLTLPAGTNGSTVRFVDATESWGTNNLTIAPATGQTIDLLAANETLICDVVRGWVELSWDGTRWAFSSLASTTVGEASASSPGIVTTGTQTFAGDKTFNGSITPSGGIIGKTDGVPVAAGNVGEVITWASAPSTQVLTTSVADWTNATIVLTPGVWQISANITVQVATGTTAANNTTGVVYVTDGSNTVIQNMESGVAVTTPAAASTLVTSALGFSAVVNISTSTTYKIRGIRIDGAGTGSAQLRNQGASYSRFYAVRITA
jgi:hypothetical protein